MKNRIHILFLLFPLFLMMGCAHVISKDLRIKTDPSVTFSQVSQDPNQYKGKLVVWGGEIIEAINQKDGTTQIEVFQKPLDRRGEPYETSASEGRFLVLVDKYLDSYLFRRGKKITVAGEILGEKIKPIGEMEYRYPLLSGKQIYLWPEYYTYPIYYYDPWWGHPYYPYGWWGFGIYHHRHRHR
ncbi:MAG: Slp/YeaY family lipoprotein [Deltaproteobacteria bacterium]|nr:Slp/YeaY family lipoprotein [Deltaproteobacteria bacterium]